MCKPYLGMMLRNLLITNANRHGRGDSPTELAACENTGFTFIGATRRRHDIAPEERNEISQRFHRIEQCEREGTGMDLSLRLEREIAEALGGESDRTRSPGRNPIFWFRLPVSQAKESQVAVEIDKVKRGSV